ncbi:MAG: hypothetical protein HF975_04450 [ANME-2 cluster archaeon]|nr:hypothetical protein [ANME-2 cluster archaeon]
MEYNELIFNKIITAAKTGSIVDKKIALYSGKSAILARYFELSNPKFTRSGALGEKLCQIASEEYPELWDKIINEIPDAKANKTSQWEGKADPLTGPDPALLESALSETLTKEGKTITIYNPRLAALFNYLSHTIPRFSISKTAAGMLEEILAREYPRMWGEIVTLTSR